MSDDHALLVMLQTVIATWRDYVPLYYAVYVIDEGSDARFLTSRNPLVDFENRPTRLLPLSSRHCLFLSQDPEHARFKRQFMRCDRNMVSEFNRMALRNAWQYVYSRTPDFKE
ncbi:DUF4238 domain-containing protein [Sphingomonas sp. MMS12-HWE2-04]|uniref:DUF4238 domain-containing protein n=1 Tax=Sphingomonas sp. MMS12-HWE2-04 TaxID=3234199 RepID=UPI0038512D5D